jgi:hypothetical protein
MSNTLLDVRGFHKKDPASQELLERIGGTFLVGYGHAVEAKSFADAATRLEQIPTRFRGFAYEGAGMGFGVRDGLPLGPNRLAEEFIAGPGDPHNYMVYVGMGWAMARLPRFRWPKASRLDPLLRWLLLDGYGFHQAYFKTQRYVREQYQDPKFPWPSGNLSGYANQAIDHGIGRAIWFICGSDPELATSTVDGFPSVRHPDLYAGLGLAATYAGGVTEEELRTLWQRAGEHRAQVAVGSAFAAECRVRAGLIVPHTELATRVLCGTTPERAAQVALNHRPQRVIEGDVPAYELWRRRVAADFASHAQSTERGQSA